MNKSINIPSLGNSAQEVLKSALNFNCAGYLLKFSIVGDGDWQYNRLTNKFEKTKLIGSIPVIDNVEDDNFDEWLLYNISKGYVTVYLQGSNYYKELHRARGVGIPLDN